MERILIDEGAVRKPVRPIPILAALTAHGTLAFLTVTTLKFDAVPPPISAPTIDVQFVVLPPPIANPEPPEVAPDPTPPVQQTSNPPEAAALPAAPALPEVNLPPAPPVDDHSVGQAREALAGYLCIGAELDEREERDCETQRLAAGTRAALAARETLVEDIARAQAVELGLATDPSSVPPVADPARDPIAPHDFSWRNPINGIRDPIPGVTHR